MRSIKHKCLDRMIPFGERHLRRALVEFVDHYHRERNHQGLGNELIDGIRRGHTIGGIRCHRRLGGLLNYLLPRSVTRLDNGFGGSARVWATTLATIRAVVVPEIVRRVVESSLPDRRRHIAAIARAGGQHGAPYRAMTRGSAAAAPCWLHDDPGLNPLEILPCRNGLLHIPSRELRRSTPNFFTLTGLDFEYIPAAPAPDRWLQFLRDLWPDDDESIATLQEFFGYVLTPRTHLQKIFMLVGPKRSGKGTIGRVLRRLLGDRNVCGPTLANMGEQFGLSILTGKSLAVIADARISGRTDTAIITERLLSISGEDALSIPRKFLPDWTGKLSTRFLILTNELPRIEDASGALASRFIVLTLKRSFYGSEDHDLFDRFVPELPSILNWALKGFDCLYARGRFRQPEASAELIRQFEDLGSPIAAFLRDRCDVGQGFDVPTDRLFQAWKAWCAENGRDRPGTVQTFGRNLRAAMPWVGETQPRILGTRVRYYEGIGLREGNA